MSFERMPLYCCRSIQFLDTTGLFSQPRIRRQFSNCDTSVAVQREIGLSLFARFVAQVIAGKRSLPSGFRLYRNLNPARLPISPHPQILPSDSIHYSYWGLWG